MSNNIFNLIKRDPKTGLVTFLNPYSFLIARNNINIFSKFNIKIDGGLLVTFLNLFGFKSQRESFDMTSLAPIIFSEAVHNKKSIYLIGSEPGIAEEAKLHFLNEFPGLDVIKTRHGFFENKQERTEVIDSIVKQAPDLLIAGMGTPYQEQFLIDLQEAGWNGIGYTCGGFLHQTAKKGNQYYPKWIDKLNLRWVYRIYDEPKLFKRYLFYYPLFVVVFLHDVIKYKLKKKYG